MALQPSQNPPRGGALAQLATMRTGGGRPAPSDTVPARVLPGGLRSTASRVVEQTAPGKAALLTPGEGVLSIDSMAALAAMVEEWERTGKVGGKPPPPALVAIMEDMRARGDESGDAGEGEEGYGCGGKVGYAQGGVVGLARALFGENPNVAQTRREVQQMQGGTYQGQPPPASASSQSAPAPTQPVAGSAMGGAIRALQGRGAQIGRAVDGYADGGAIAGSQKQGNPLGRLIVNPLKENDDIPGGGLGGYLGDVWRSSGALGQRLVGSVRDTGLLGGGFQLTKEVGHGLIEGAKPFVKSAATLLGGHTGLAASDRALDAGAPPQPSVPAAQSAAGVAAAAQQAQAASTPAVGNTYDQDGNPVSAAQRITNLRGLDNGGAAVDFTEGAGRGTVSSAYGQGIDRVIRGLAGQHAAPPVVGGAPTAMTPRGVAAAARQSGGNTYDQDGNPMPLAQAYQPPQPDWRALVNAASEGYNGSTQIGDIPAARAKQHAAQLLLVNALQNQGRLGEAALQNQSRMGELAFNAAQAGREGELNRGALLARAMLGRQRPGGGDELKRMEADSLRAALAYADPQQQAEALRRHKAVFGAGKDGGDDGQWIQVDDPNFKPNPNDPLAAPTKKLVWASKANPSQARLVDIGAAQTQPSAQSIAPGTVMDGHRFKGGNPADQKNWEKL